MNKLGIIGSGELGAQILNIARQQNIFDIVGFFDDYENIHEKYGTRVLGPLNAIEKCIRNGQVTCLSLAIGYKHMGARKALYERFSELCPFATIVHPFSFIDETALVGPGCIIYPGTVIDKNVVVRENTVLNNGCIISHDSIVGPHSFLSPNTALAGFVSIGECAYLGISTTVIDNISIASNIQTGGGTVVIKDIQQAGLYVGNPARFIR